MQVNPDLRYICNVTFFKLDNAYEILLFLIVPLVLLCQSAIGGFSGCAEGARGDHLNHCIVVVDNSPL